MSLQALLDWLTALPSGALLASMAVLAAVENIFPPIPADLLVAFGGFLAARNGDAPWPAFLAIWLGNVAGALFTYAMGRRLGREWIARRFRLSPGGANEARLSDWYTRYGPVALFVSRFLPGVRSIVPPMAGALHIPVTGLLLAISLASALWYGLITWLAFSAGSNWEALSTRIAQLGTVSAVVAVVLVAAAAVLWWIRGRRT